MNSAECKAEFRVEKHDLPRLVAALQLPPVFKCEQRSICDDMEGLCILLKRVAYPCRLSDLIPRFGRPVSVISLISNDVIDYIYDVHGHRITQWNRDLLNPGALQRYAEAISGKGGPLNNCFGFVDGTVRPFKTKWASENCVQWPQEGPRVKIPTLAPTKWTYWEPIWTRWWVCNKKLVF